MSSYFFFSITEGSNLGSPLSHIAKFAVERAGAWLGVSQGLGTCLFFSCEPFEHALFVNLVLSMRARGGPRLSVSLTHTQWLLCTWGPQGHALDAPSLTRVKHVLDMDILVVGVVVLFFLPCR